MLLTVECLERCALRHGLHHNLVTLHHVCIEGVQRLSVGHHHIVGDIHDVIDRTQANGGQLVLQPLRRFLHLTVSNTHTSIAFAGLLILNHHLDRQVMILHLELRAVRTMQRGLVAIALQPGIEVTGYAPMRETISTVGCDIHLNEPVALQMIILSSRRTHNSILRQYDDTGMVMTDSNLILCTDHTVRLHTTKL